MSFHYRHRKKIILTIIAVVLLLVFGTLGFVFSEEDVLISDSNNVNFDINKEEDKEIEETEDEVLNDYVQFDVKGEVNAPGTYKLENGLRVIDAINQAGGLTNNADTSLINLSKKVTDEMVIIVYSTEEIANYIQTKENENIEQELCSSNSELKNDACIDNDNIMESVTGVININYASMEELMTLPGIGEGKAQDIIDYRSEHGLFSVIEDLMNVSGIGESTFASLKENITV